jgi:MerR family copper efflux transcriptional regulator
VNIGIAAAHSALPAKTIRYYEEIGLITPGRLDNGYRDYSDVDIQLLRFVQRARSLGFSVEHCRQLLDLYRDKTRASADVRRLAAQKVTEIEEKISDLIGLRDTLSDLVDHCHGDVRPDCPILDMLSDGDSANGHHDPT